MGNPEMKKDEVAVEVEEKAPVKVNFTSTVTAKVNTEAEALAWLDEARKSIAEKGMHIVSISLYGYKKRTYTKNDGTKETTPSYYSVSVSAAADMDGETIVEYDLGW